MKRIVEEMIEEETMVTAYEIYVQACMKKDLKKQKKNMFN